MAIGSSLRSIGHGIIMLLAGYFIISVFAAGYFAFYEMKKSDQQVSLA